MRQICLCYGTCSLFNYLSLASKPLVYALLRVWCSIRLDLITIPKSDRSENPFLCVYFRKKFRVAETAKLKLIGKLSAFQQNNQSIKPSCTPGLEKKWLKVKTSKLDSNVVFLVRFHDEGLLSGTAYVPSISSRQVQKDSKTGFQLELYKGRHVANKIVVWCVDATKMSVIVS